MVNEQIPKFRVSDFLAVVNQSLEVAFGLIEVEGEVSSFKVNHQKYVFFDLKDADGSVNCFMMVYQLRTPIEDGMRVVVRAVPKVTNWGKFSLTVQEIRPVGEGDIRKSADLLRLKLEKEGLFDEARKRTLPTRPSNVALISSPQAAGYADFMKILSERWGGMKIKVFATKVQGLEAADQMIKALERVNSGDNLPEVVVLIRGGGSADDLSAFNDEKLVRAIAASRVPTLVGVGHETDTTLADLAADVRAATPSNAAQILVPDRQQVINDAWRRANLVVDLTKRRVADMRNEVGQLSQRAESSLRQNLISSRQLVGSLRRLAEGYDPNAVLSRGYAIIRGGLSVGEIIKIETKNAIMEAEIKKYDQK